MAVNDRGSYNSKECRPLANAFANSGRDRGGR